MTSDRSQRRIERLLDQIDAAEASGDRTLVSTFAHDVLDLAADNPEALAELLVATDGDPIRVQELDERSLDIANSIGMKPLIRRILSMREILKA